MTPDAPPPETLRAAHCSGTPDVTRAPDEASDAVGGGGVGGETPEWRREQRAWLDAMEDEMFAVHVAAMEPSELRERIIRQATFIRSYQRCLDGLGLPGRDEHRFPDDIRRDVSQAVGAVGGRDDARERSGACSQSGADQRPGSGASVNQ